MAMFRKIGAFGLSSALLPRFQVITSRGKNQASAQLLRCSSFSSQDDDAAERRRQNQLQQQRKLEKEAQIAYDKKVEQILKARKNPKPEEDMMKKAMEELFSNLKGEGDEFIPKTLALLDDAVNSCLEFQGSEEELQLVLGVAEVMIEMTDHKDALEAEAEEEFVKGALKVLTLAKGLTSASIELCKVIPRGGVYEFTFITERSFEGAYNAATSFVKVNEKEDSNGDDASFIVVFLSFKAWILKVKKTQLIPPFSFP